MYINIYVYMKKYTYIYNFRILSRVAMGWGRCMSGDGACVCRAIFVLRGGKPLERILYHGS